MESLEHRLLLTGNPYLVENLHVDHASSLPRHLTEFQGEVYFSATDRHGNELWKSDGTEEGTVMVSDLRPGPDGSFPDQLIEFRNELYFFADSGASGQRWLWKSDGTQGVTKIAEFEYVGIGVKVFEDSLYFIAEDQLWQSDGSESGTHLVDVARPITAERMFVSDDALFLSGQDGPQKSVWKISNGEISRVLQGLGADGDVVGIAQLHDEVFFSGQDPNVPSRKLVWKLAQGSEAATLVQVIDGADNIEMVAAPHAVLIRINRPHLATDTPAPTEIWRTDGTEEGTYQLKFTTPDQFDPLWLVPGVDRVIIYSGTEIWGIDGTQEGTHRLSSIDARRWSTSSATLDGEQYLFGDELWRTDGTEPGTIRIKDIEGPKFPEIVEVEDTLYFNGDGGDGFELWKSDGTTEGTSLVRDILPGESLPDSSSRPHVEPQNLTVVQDLLYFTHGDSLHVSDGAVDDTRKIAEVVPSRTAHLGDAGIFKVYGPSLLTDVLWTTNGTEEGTRPYFEFDREYRRVLLNDLQMGGELFFFAESSNSGRELWKTDGTEGGTSRVVTINGPLSEPPVTESELEQWWEIVAFKDRLFYRVITDDSQQLWVSDGTAENAEMIFDFGPRSAVPVSRSISIRDYPFDFEVVGDRLVFAVNTEESGRELWTTDGTTAGTMRLTDIVEGDESSLRDVSALWVADEKVFFVAGDRAVGSNAFGTALFASDGTIAGTRQIIDPERSSKISVFEAVEFNNELYFTAWLSAEHGVELYRSDGTVEGTRLVKDILPGSRNGAPRELTVFDGKLYFTAQDALVDDRELWESDGTPEGTRPVPATRAGSAASEPLQLTPTDSHLFFTADDGISGRELWALSKDRLADFDNDGAVAFSDFLIMSGNFGKNDASFEEGDVNGDKEVTFADFLLLAAQFGQRAN